MALCQKCFPVRQEPWPYAKRPFPIAPVPLHKANLHGGPATFWLDLCGRAGRPAVSGVASAGRLRPAAKGLSPDEAICAAFSQTG